MQKKRNATIFLPSENIWKKRILHSKFFSLGSNGDRKKSKKKKGNIFFLGEISTGLGNKEHTNHSMMSCLIKCMFLFGSSYVMQARHLLQESKKRDNPFRGYMPTVEWGGGFHFYIFELLCFFRLQLEGSNGGVDTPCHQHERVFFERERGN